jgi:hypothetical protein
MPYVATSPFWQFVDHWQTLIAGTFALLAGATAYIAGVQQARATTQSSRNQLIADARKDRLQARCIAVGIAPELGALRVAHESSVRMIDAVADLDQSTSMMAHKFLSDGCIEIPPILARNIDHLYLLGEPAGPTILQLVSVTLQYNHMLETLAQRLKEHPHFIDPPKHKNDCSGHLKMIEELIDMADNEIEGCIRKLTGNFPEPVL